MSRVRRRTGLRASRLLAALVSVAVVTACGSTGYESAGPFRPKPEGAPPEVGPPSETVPAPAPGEPAEPGTGNEQPGDPNVVASGLAVPTGLVVLPDGSAVVGERDTGRLLQVFPDRSPAKVLMTVPGVDAGGNGGLLGLALSPTYQEDGLLYAYLSTATDNRVVRFPVGGTPNVVFTGIPRGEVHNGGGLVFGTDGTLYVGTGDTGDPRLAGDPTSLAGKVLRIDVFGHRVGNRPYFTRGHRDVTALCAGGQGVLFATDDASTGPDELDALADGGDYGAASSNGDPVVEIPGKEGGLGGCAVAGNSVFLGALDGERVHVIMLDGRGVPTGDPDELLGGRYGRLRTTVLDSQGGLWITTSNKDGVGRPAADDDKVLRILPPSAQGDSPL